MGNKTKVRIFISYARANKALAKKFLNGYKDNAKASKNYEYEFWQDEDLLIGEESWTLTKTDPLLLTKREPCFAREGIVSEGF